MRRARASSLSLIPTSTGSATAIGLIYPELLGKLTGIAVRVPLLNASLTDCVFEVLRAHDGRRGQRARSSARRAARSKGILGYEERPLVSVDFKDDPRSAIIDAPSTMVVDGTCVKVLAWYDNEIGYVQSHDRTGREGRRHAMSAPARAIAAAAPTISIRNYATVTAAYWAFTLTDGALRMLVLLHFNQLGYTPVQLAFLFLLYEFFGIVTNLVGGWVASRTGVRFTLVARSHASGAGAGAARPAQSRLEHGDVGRLRDGLPGALGDREGPDEDEREERRQGARAERRRFRLVQMGRRPHRIEECAEGRGLLRRRISACRGSAFEGRSRPWPPACSSSCCS